MTPTHRYISRAKLMSISVFLPSSTAIPISFAVFLVASRPSRAECQYRYMSFFLLDLERFFIVFQFLLVPSIKGTSERISSGALARRSSRSSSSCTNWILYCWNAACRAWAFSSSSGRSLPTVLASSWSSRPRSVAMKLMSVHCAAISGL